MTHTLRQGTAEELAYCAGVLDSDGYIGIRRSTYGMRVTGTCSQPVYAIRVKLKQVERGAVLLFQELFGGNLHLERPSTARGKPLWAWEQGHRRAAFLLERLAPWLRIKCRQAENCLQLRDLITTSQATRGRSLRPQQVTVAMETCYQTAKQLNKLGAGDGFFTRYNVKPDGEHSLRRCADRIAEDSSELDPPGGDVPSIPGLESV